MFEQEKIRIDEEKTKQINMLKEKYEQEKQQTIEKILNQIV